MFWAYWSISSVISSNVETSKSRADVLTINNYSDFIGVGFSQNILLFMFFMLITDKNDFKSKPY